MCFTLYTVPVPPGPIAHWPFDEESGNVAMDLLGDHNGQIHDATYTDGRLGRALHFNGLNAFVDLGDSNQLSPDEMTLTLWVRPEHMGGVRYAINRTHTDDFTDYAILCHLSGMVEFVFDERGSGPGSVLSNTQLTLEE